MNSLKFGTGHSSILHLLPVVVVCLAVILSGVGVVVSVVVGVVVGEVVGVVFIDVADGVVSITPTIHRHM